MSEGCKRSFEVLVYCDTDKKLAESTHQANNGNDVVPAKSLYESCADVYAKGDRYDCHGEARYTGSSYNDKLMDESGFGIRRERCK